MAPKKAPTSIPKKNAKAPTKNTPKIFMLGQSADSSPPEVTPETYNDFDTSNLKCTPITKNEFKVGKQTIVSVKNEWYYEDPETKEQFKFYWFGPSAICFAPSYQYPYGDDKKESKDEEEAKKAENKDPKSRKGVQMGYPLTTLATCKAPSDLEAAYMNFLDRIHDRAIEIGFAEVKKKAKDSSGKFILPAVSRSQFTAAQVTDEDEDEEANENRRRECVKRLYTPYHVDAAGKDKPAVAYVPLVTSGKGDELRCQTKFYDHSSGEAISPLSITSDKDSGVGSSRGEMDYPLFFLKENYFGQHGLTAAGMSIKHFLVQADWSEVEGGGSTYIPETRSFGGHVEQWKPPSRADSDFPDDSEGESDEEVQVKSAAKPKAKTKAKSKAVEADLEEDDEADEGEIEMPKKPAKAKAKSKTKVVEADVDDEVDEEEEVEMPKKPAKAKAKAKARVIEADVEDEDEIEEEIEMPKPKAKAKAKSKARKLVVENDEEEE